MIRTLLLSSLLASGLPAVAWAAVPDHHHAAVPHSHQTIKLQGITATFHVQAPAKTIYTCTMHPEVAAEKPGACPKCGMALEKQTHHIAVSLQDAKKAPIEAAMVRLLVKDANGGMQGVNTSGRGYYQSGFRLEPGRYTISAFVKPTASAKTLEFKVPYEVK